MPWISKYQWDRLNDRVMELESAVKFKVGKDNFAYASTVLRTLMEKLGYDAEYLPPKEGSYQLVQRLKLPCNLISPEPPNKKRRAKRGRRGK